MRQAKRGRRGRVLLRLAAGAVLLVLLKAAWFIRYRAQPGIETTRSAREDLLARRAYLVHRVLSPGFGPREFPEALGSQFQGEWALVTLSMTALSIGGLAQQFPDAAGTSQAELESIAERALTSEIAAFDTERWQQAALSTLHSPSGHIGYLGHLALILAVRETCFPGGRHRALLAQLARALTRKLAQAPCGLAETYPGELYVPDNAVAMAALALAARAGLAPDISAGLLRTLQARYASAPRHLLPFRVDSNCKARDSDRASGATWNLLYLALVDPDLLRNRYPSLLDSFLDCPIPGIWGFREWPRGVARGGDIDSGPLVLGLSPAATGFAIASARRMGDAHTMQQLLDTAELAGFSIEFSDRRRYLLAPLVGDATILAARAPLQVF